MEFRVKEKTVNSLKGMLHLDQVKQSPFSGTNSLGISLDSWTEI